MLKEFENLPYRKNIAVILFQNQEFLLVQKPHWKSNWWKFVQGGIDKNEELIQAGLRELKEEVGTDNVKIIGISKYTNTYDWPDNLLKTLKKKIYSGQTQNFVIAQFLGEKKDIIPDKKEISNICWLKREQILKLCEEKIGTFDNYKDNVIEKIFAEFNL